MGEGHQTGTRVFVEEHKHLAETSVRVKMGVFSAVSLLVPPIGRPQAEIDLSSHDEKVGSGSIVAAKTKIWGSGVFVMGDMFCPLLRGP